MLHLQQENNEENRNGSIAGRQSRKNSYHTRQVRIK